MSTNEMEDREDSIDLYRAAWRLMLEAAGFDAAEVGDFLRSIEGGDDRISRSMIMHRSPMEPILGIVLAKIAGTREVEQRIRDSAFRILIGNAESDWMPDNNSEARRAIERLRSALSGASME